MPAQWRVDWRLASGSAFPVGKTTNTFKVTDAAGNTATCSFVVTVTANAVTELPSYPLHGYQLSWKLLDEHGDLTLTGSQALGELRTPESVTGTVPRDAAGSRRKLIVTLLRPSGMAAAEQSFSYPQ